MSTTSRSTAWRACLISVIGLMAAFPESAAFGQTGDYLNLSFAGDGETPTAAERFAAQVRSAPATVGGAGGASFTGDAGWSAALPLPPAHLAPSVSVSYSSAGGYGRVGRGMELGVGPTLRRLSDREQAAYAARVEPTAPPVADLVVYRVDGIGSGIVWKAGSTWRWMSDSDPVGPAVSYTSGTRTFTIVRDGVTWTLAPDTPAGVVWGSSLTPTSWHAASAVDGKGNRVDWTWTADRPAGVRYGGTSTGTHFLEATFEWGPAAHATVEARDGALHDTGHRLRAVQVASAFGGSSFVPKVRWELAYDDEDEHVVSIDEQGLGLFAATRRLVTFEWGAWSDAYAEVLGEDAVPAYLMETFSETAALSSDPSDPYQFDGASLSSTDLFLDVNADGLADQSDGFWMEQGVDGGSVDRTWTYDSNLPLGGDETFTVVVDEGPFQGDPWQEDFWRRATYGTRKVIDVDGDGFPDVVETAATPLEYLDDPAAEAINNAAANTSWTVSWGSATGYTQTVITAPRKFPLVTTRPDIPVWADSSEIVVTEGAEVDLQDMDGDGWTDLVLYGGDQIRWHRKLPGRTTGFATSAVVALDLTSVSAELLSGGRTRSTFVEPDPVQLALNTVVVPRIDTSWTVTGLQDLNGDGALDWVSAEGWTVTVPTWTVWFGRGDGTMSPTPSSWWAPTDGMTYSTEGEAMRLLCLQLPSSGAVDFELIRTLLSNDPTNGTVQEYTGPGAECVTPPTATAKVFDGPMDLDGDGRVDLVVGRDDVWHRNLGDGFAIEGTPLPEWVVHHEGQGVLSATRTSQWTMTAEDNQLSNPVDSETTTTTLFQTLDVDRDGLPDVVDLRSGAQGIRFSGRWSESWPNDPTGPQQAGVPRRPGLLSRVVDGHGGITAFEWISSAVQEGVGESFGSSVYTPNHKVLLSGLHVFDPITGFEGKREFGYADAVHVPGRFVGFEQVVETHLVSEPYALLDWPSPGFLARVPYGRSVTRYALDPVHQVVTEREEWTDWNRRWLTGASELLSKRWEEARAYNELLPIPASAFVPKLLTTSASEVFNTSGMSVTSESSTITRAYDASNRPTTQTHAAASRPEDQIRVTTSWVGSASLGLHRPGSLETWSTNLDSGSLELVERGTFEYDGLPAGVGTAGLLTRQRIEAGPVGALATEVLDWSFGRTSRGAVAWVDGPLGDDVTYGAYTFGGTVPGTTTNAANHVTTQTVDALGRIDATTDPNGVVHTVISDSLGRPKERWVKGVGFGFGFLTEHVNYTDDTTPRWSKAIRYAYDDTGNLHVPDEQAETRSIVDGFGRALQTWTENTLTNTWTVREAESDVRGVLRRESEPHVEALPGTFPEFVRGPNRTTTMVDALGEAIESWSLDTGSASLDHPEPRTTRRLLEDGYERRELTDSLGRLREVRQGLLGGTVPVGTYRWDGRDRVRQFDDGAGNAWRTTFDGAGRARVVQRRDDPGAAWATWVSYDWDGPHPVAQYDGSNLTPSVTWEYDDLGRTEGKEVSDPVLGTPAVYTWTWDTSWKGARTSVTDPSGHTDYEYAAGAFGQLGYVTQTKRVTGTVVATRSFAHDLYGNVVSETWPSGASVERTWAASGQLASATATPAAGTAATFTPTFSGIDGLPVGFTLDLGAQGRWTAADTRSSSTQLATRTWKNYDASQLLLDTRTLGLDWSAGGRLVTKSLTGIEPISYHYDGLGRIDRVIDGLPAGTVNFETYTRDVAGNPTQMRQRTAANTQWTWAYGATTRFNEVPSRTRTNGGTTVTESFAYDPVTSRLTGWSTDWNTPNTNDAARTYVYDGAGRLRRVAKTGSGATTETYHSDVDDQIVWEERGGGVSVFRHDGWESRGVAGSMEVTEELLPGLARRGSAWVVRLMEPDGHAVRTWSRNPTTGVVSTTQELLGAFGLNLYKYQTSPGSWVIDGYHGEEVNRVAEVVHKGARHVVLRDGMWMQPEPLLYLGLTNGDLATPLGYSGVYAAGDSNALQDASGRFPAAIPIVAGGGAAVAGGAAIVGAAALTGILYFNVLETVGVVGAVQDAAASALQVVASPAGTANADPDEARAMNWAASMETTARAGNNGVEGPVNRVPRVTRDGSEGVKLEYPDGSTKDVTNGRVKEFVPVKDERAPAGTVRRVKFEDAQPGSKGLKRDPTPEDLEEAGL